MSKVDASYIFHNTAPLVRVLGRHRYIPLDCVICFFVKTIGLWMIGRCGLVLNAKLFPEFCVELQLENRYSVTTVMRALSFQEKIVKTLQVNCMSIHKARGVNHSRFADIKLSSFNLQRRVHNYYLKKKQPSNILLRFMCEGNTV